MVADSRPDLSHKTGCRLGRLVDLPTHLVGPTAAHVRRGLIKIERDLQEWGLPQELVGTSQIVLAEVLNNIVVHARPDPESEISLWLCWDGECLACRIEDGGNLLPGEVLPDGTFPDPETLPEGGFGWPLIRYLASHLVYQRMPHINSLRFSVLA